MKFLKLWTQEEKNRFFDYLLGKPLTFHDYYKDWNGCGEVWEWLNKDEQEDLYIAFRDKVKPLWEWTIFYPKERFLDRFIQFLLDNVEEWEWAECFHIAIEKDLHYPDCYHPDYCDCQQGKLKHPALVYAEGME